MNNPLLNRFDTPYQSAPFAQIKPEHFIPAIDLLIEEADKDIQAIADHPDAATFENTILPLETNGEKLGRAVEVLFNLNHAETTEEIQKIAQDVSPKLSAFSSKMLMNERLFGRVRDVYENAGKSARPCESIEECTIINNYYDNFIRNGAELGGTKKQRFADIKSELATLTLQFGENVLAETNAFHLHIEDKTDLAGLPDFVKEAAVFEAKQRELSGWVFTLH